MPVITLFSGSYCHEEDVVREIVKSTGYTLIADQQLIGETARRFQMEEGKLLKAMTQKMSIFNKFTHEKERSLACLKVVLADLIRQDNILLVGFASLMIPKDISHVLKSCIIADIKYRADMAVKEQGFSERDALKKIHKDDESRVLWVEYLSSQKDPWAAELYDIVIPMDKYDAEAAAKLVCENVRKDVLKVTDGSRRAVEDFVLASQVNLKLAGEGHNTPVTAKDGHITVTINKHVLMLASLEGELKKIVMSVPGVSSVETAVGPGYYQTDIYRKVDFDLPLPSKVLLVDDERDFIQTLSERLQMRDLGSAVVYGGEEALSVVDEDEPEVMVLDLKMPGVDGLEVLQRVKKEHPNVEIIVLTGHGSQEIERRCLEMGACAYLEKPVDIEVLTRTMKEAYRKLKERKEEDNA
jgi:two-component system, OmpR family, response regulator CpxR